MHSLGSAHTDGELALLIRERSDVPIATDQTKMTDVKVG